MGAVGKMVHDAVSARAFLTARRSRLARLLVPEQRRRDIARIRMLETFREHRRVFDRLHRALSHVREHRMRRVAHQRDAPNGPSRKFVAVVKRPAIGRLNRADDRADLRMPSFALRKSIGDLAFGGPRLDAPFAGSDGDPVVITRPRANIVMNEVMPRSPPGNGGDLDSQLLDAIRGNQTAISYVSGKSRRLR